MQHRADFIRPVLHFLFRRPTFGQVSVNFHKKTCKEFGKREKFKKALDFVRQSAIL